MKTQVAATFVSGQFKPDHSVPLPEAARVTLTIELLDDEAESETDTEPQPTPEESMAAWKALKAFIKKHPIHGGGKRFNRDELYERR